MKIYDNVSHLNLKNGQFVFQIFGDGGYSTYRVIELVIDTKWLKDVTMVYYRLKLISTHEKDGTVNRRQKGLIILMMVTDHFTTSRPRKCQ